MKQNQISKSRKRLISLSANLSHQVENVIAASALLKGTICEKRRKCGNPRCKCAGGEPHTTKILSFSEGGKTKIIHLTKYPVMELSAIERQVKEYQRFRRNRAKIVAHFKLLMTEINKLERSLLVNIEKGKNSNGKKKTE